MTEDKIVAACVALAFAFFAAHAFRTQQVPKYRSFTGPRLRRRDHPVRFWTYAVSMVLGAAFATYAAIFLA